jgi:hypothetical protein
MSHKKSEARRKYWATIPKEKRKDHGVRMVTARWNKVNQTKTNA